MLLLARAGRHLQHQQQAPGLLLLLRSFTSNSTKEAVEHALIVDTLAQSKKFESLGFTREQAEDMTQYLTEQIVLDRLRLSDKFSAKVELEKVWHSPESSSAVGQAAPGSVLQCGSVQLCTPSLCSGSNIHLCLIPEVTVSIRHSTLSTRV